MKTILILGAGGMAGHVVYHHLKETNAYKLIPVCHKEPISKDSILLDIKNTEQLITIIQNSKPDFVINCIGVLIKGSNNNPANAIYINAYFPHLLSSLVKKHATNGKLIHISTDCVFSGKKGFYTPNEEKDALDVYGMTKNLGELNNNQDLTIRTSIIGPELKKQGEGLFHWLFSNSDSNIKGYTKSIWGGITTLELAKNIRCLIENPEVGLIQITNGKAISKFDLLKLIKDIFKLHTQIEPVDGLIVPGYK